MKQLFTIFAFVLLGLAVNAQYIYNDFDGNQNEPFIGFNNNPEIVANPDASGINTSANVAQWERGEGFQWAHVTTSLEGMIDFETGTTFQLKVYSPIACEVLFKLEDKTNAGTFFEVMGNVTTANQWQLLTYDFSGAPTGTYDKIVIFFDFATTVNNIFYFDDVEGPEYGGGVTPGDPVSLPVTFNDDEINYGLTDFGGNVSEIVVDPTNAENKVAKSIKTETAETWAGTTVGGTVGFDAPIAFAEGATTMTVAVWSPTTDTPIRLKVEAANDPTISVETETLTTMAEAWEVITFDFSNEAPGTAEINFGFSYNKASIFFNFGTDGATAGEQTYYWDDMEFEGGGVEPKPLEAWDVQDNFEDDGYATISDWKLQDPELMDLTIVADPMNAENHVAEYNRSGAFEWTNAQFILDHRMDLSVRNKFEIMVYFPSTNAYDDMLTPTAALKLQNSLLGGGAWETQTEIKLTVEEYDVWVTLEFDFAEVADRDDYDQVVVQLGGEGHFVPGMFYFDNIHLMDNSSIWEQNVKSFNIFPNPVTDEFVIEGLGNVSNVRVYNMQGQVVVAESGNVSVLNVSQLASGVYQVVAKTSEGVLHTSKMLKK